MKSPSKGNFPSHVSAEAGSLEVKKYHNYSLSFYQKDDALN